MGGLQVRSVTLTRRIQAGAPFHVTLIELGRTLEATGWMDRGEGRARASRENLCAAEIPSVAQRLKVQSSLSTEMPLVQ
jgi:hypothetical protein